MEGSTSSAWGMGSSGERFGWDIITGFRKLAEPAGYQVEVVPLTQELQRSIAYDEYMLRESYRGDSSWA